MKNFILILIILAVPSCVREENITSTLVFNLGDLDSIEIQIFNDTSVDEGLQLELTQQILLNEGNVMYITTDTDFSVLTPVNLINADSVSVIFNDDKQSGYLARDRDRNLFFLSSYYIRQGNTFTKTFTIEDYENADPI
jgi:hypothetical protein